MLAPLTSIGSWKNPTGNPLIAPGKVSTFRGSYWRIYSISLFHVLFLALLSFEEGNIFTFFMSCFWHCYPLKKETYLPFSCSRRDHSSLVFKSSNLQISITDWSGRRKAEELHHGSGSDWGKKGAGRPDITFITDWASLSDLCLFVIHANMHLLRVQTQFICIFIFIFIYGYIYSMRMYKCVADYSILIRGKGKRGSLI